MILYPEFQSAQHMVEFGLLTPRLLKEHSDQGAEVSFLVGEGVVIRGEASSGNVLYGSNVLDVSRVLALAGYPHGVRFWFGGL